MGKNRTLSLAEGDRYAFRRRGRLNNQEEGRSAPNRRQQA